MEFMKIGDSAIKISLGAKEAAEYNITEDMVAENNEIKRSFSGLLERAKRELGVRLPSGKLLCEVFSSRDGGYEIFVSYLKQDENNVQKEHKFAFCIDSSDSLLYVKKRLDTLCQDYEIYAYEGTKKWYLILKSSKHLDLSLGFIYELATPLCQGNLKYIQQYALKIAP